MLWCFYLGLSSCGGNGCTERDLRYDAFEDKGLRQRVGKQETGIISDAVCFNVCMGCFIVWFWLERGRDLGEVGLEWDLGCCHPNLRVWIRVLM